MKLKLAIVLFFSLCMITPSHALFDEEKALLESENNSINVYSRVVPSVVNVTNMKVAGNVFHGFEKVPAGMGTGFVWDKSGHIVTNYHVIEGGTEFVISFYKDRKQYKAKVVGTEPRLDVAVLKLIEMPSKLSPLPAGLSKQLKVGQKTIAIGNPFGLDHSMSVGIVSALGRQIMGIGGVKIHDMIQTDAAINQGNSGGPLLNSRGEVIGVNTMIYSPSGSNAGLGFAVPIDSVKRVVPDLIAFGRVKRPSLGIVPLDDQYKEYYFGTRKGLVIKSIYEDSPAYKSGLRGMQRDVWGRAYLGDIITKVDGKEVNNLDDIYHLLGNYKSGDVVKIEYRRKKKTYTTKVKLEAI